MDLPRTPKYRKHSQLKISKRKSVKTIQKMKRMRNALIVKLKNQETNSQGSIKDQEVDDLEYEPFPMGALDALDALDDSDSENNEQQQGSEYDESSTTNLQNAHAENSFLRDHQQPSSAAKSGYLHTLSQDKLHLQQQYRLILFKYLQIKSEYT